MKVSTRHHYIPQFYTKGFTNEAGFLFVYDKQKNFIQKNISPKSIFFENDRNTLKLDKETSILEDVFYKQVDEKCSHPIHNLREAANQESILNYDNLAGVQFFIVCLFWRIPKTNGAVKRYIQDAQITFTNKDGDIILDPVKEQELKNDENYIKFQRAFIGNKALRGYTQTSGQIYAQLFEKSENFFLLGDYPMLFRKTPSTFDDLFHTDFYLPISSNRIFYSAKNKRELKFDFRKLVQFNALIINQSERYICCSNLEYLERSVAYYKHIKALHLIPFLQDEFFKD